MSFIGSRPIDLSALHSCFSRTISFNSAKPSGIIHMQKTSLAWQPFLPRYLLKVYLTTHPHYQCPSHQCPPHNHDLDPHDQHHHHWYPQHLDWTISISRMVNYEVTQGTLLGTSWKIWESCFQEEWSPKSILQKIIPEDWAYFRGENQIPLPIEFGKCYHSDNALLHIKASERSCRRGLCLRLYDPVFLKYILPQNHVSTWCPLPSQGTLAPRNTLWEVQL